MSYKIHSLMICLFASATTALSQTGQAAAQPQQPIVYQLRQQPVGIDNYQSGFYYYNGKKAYTMRSFNMLSTGEIMSLKVNPSGSSYAVLTHGKKQNSIVVYDLWKPNEQIATVKEKGFNPTAICYSANAKLLYAADADGTVHSFSIYKYKDSGSFNIAAPASRMAVSSNGYFLATVGGSSVYIYNVDGFSHELRSTVKAAATVNDVAFSADSKWLAVLSADGKCSVYDTRTFAATHTFEALGSAQACFFHPAGKYLGVATGDSRVALLNLYNTDDRQYVDADEPGISYINFAKGTDGGVYLVYNTRSRIVFAPVFFLTPNRRELLRNELNDRMEEWARQMEGETMEEYNLRVNDETRAKQMQLFQTEIATEMAADMLSMSEVKIGNYNTDMNMLAIEFDKMPTIYLAVSPDQVTDFDNPADLRFANTQYFLNDKDEFELAYTEVFNTKTGKSYVFDNRERKSLDYLESDDNFVPLEQLKASRMEELRLEELRNSVMNEAKATNVITDHTKIDVNTKVVSTTDASGKKISNYEVNISYTVDEEYSAKDDFAPGRFRCNESAAAKAMLAVVKQALEGDLAKYVANGKQLNIHITGMADAIPFTKAIAYDGCYGEYDREPVYRDSELASITVTRTTGIADNDQLAFMRAMGVKDYMQTNIPSLAKMRTEWTSNTEVSKEKGSQYRRIGVKLTFVDAF